MPDFSYIALGPNGQRIAGTAAAASEDALAATLRMREQYLVESRPADEDEDVIDLSKIRVLERVTRRDVIFFTTQLSTIVSTGVNLIDGLRGIEAVVKAPMKKVVADRSHIESGDSLSTAMGSIPGLRRAP